MADTTASTTPVATSSKSIKGKSLVITLKLGQTTLAQYPQDPLARKAVKTKPTIAVSPPEDASLMPTTNDEPNTEVTTPASQSTPKLEAGSLAPPQNNGLKRKATSIDGSPAPKKDKADENGAPKPRGKPGPKRRKGLPDGETQAPASHRLGPKANQGAINAQLRALDRTGKLSRRWQRAPFSFTSFTGHKWELPQWNTAKLYGPEVNGDAHSENTGSSDAKGEHQPSSAVQSENGLGVGTPTVIPDIASSPPAIPAPLESAPASSVAAG